MNPNNPIYPALCGDIFRGAFASAFCQEIYLRNAAGRSASLPADLGVSPQMLARCTKHAVDTASKKLQFASPRDFYKSLKNPASRRVAVIGSGIVGLSVAMELLSRNFPVDIFEAELQSSDEAAFPTASPAAAAFWMPFLVNGASNEADLARWAQETYTEWATARWADTDLVVQGECRILDSHLDDPNISWIKPMLPWLRTQAGLKEEKFTDRVRETGRPKARTQVRFQTYIIDTRKLMPLLRNKVEAMGGNFFQRTLKLGDLEKMAQAEYAQGWLINCTGAGAATLVDEPEPNRMERIRGDLLFSESVIPGEIPSSARDADKSWKPQVLILEQDPISDKLAYLVCHKQYYLLGGTALEEFRKEFPDKDESADVQQAFNAKQRDLILHRCTESGFLPADWEVTLKQHVSASTLTHRFGFRPKRHGGPRVEKDPVNPNIVHNYGHSGSGWTLCWGCAREVASILSNNKEETQAIHYRDIISKL